jgi:hypothetical protein
MLTETMERRPEIGFASYDRFFPSQDNMPVGGFGNLIALPLQRGARELGNSVFIDEDLRPYEDQWAFLAAIPRLSVNAAAEIVGDAEMRGRVLGVRMPVEDEDADEPWRMTPSRRPKAGPLGIPLPSKITIVVADQLYIDRTDLPTAMTARLIRLAAFQNPEFYVELIRGEGAVVELDDQRAIGNPLPSRVQFQGALHSPQVKAFDALAPMTMACSRRPPPSARRLWLLRSLLNGAGMRLFSSIVESCSANGWNALRHFSISIRRISVSSRAAAAS